jgi:hypothetical protein
MRDLRYIIIFLIIILFSGLGVSYFKEGLDCANNEINSNGKCIKNNSIVDYKTSNNPNNIYVVLFLVILIVWLVIIKQES